MEVLIECGLGAAGAQLHPKEAERDQRRHGDARRRRGGIGRVVADHEQGGRSGEDGEQHERDLVAGDGVHHSGHPHRHDGAERACLGWCLVTTDWTAGKLSRGQRDFVRAQLGDEIELVSDMSWGLVDTRVLHVQAGAEHFVVKAAGPDDHHIGREITAHESATGALLSQDLCARLVAADRESNILITTFAPGTLVEGTAAERSPELYAQAGAVLRAFHGENGRLDDEHESRETDRALERLAQAHRIADDVVDRVRETLSGYSPRPILVVPTHGDWQPRNWVFDGHQVRAIDFGRFAYRPAASDLCRLAAQQWRADPRLEDAFLSGYGGDPRDPEVWPIDVLREAVGTAVWAYQVGDEPFEKQGHRMLQDALRQF